MNFHQQIYRGLFAIVMLAGTVFMAASQPTCTALMAQAENFEVSKVVEVEAKAAKKAVRNWAAHLPGMLQPSSR